MSYPDLITTDTEILGGTAMFAGTRVPIRTLFDYLDDNYTLDEFLECFPSVTAEMTRSILSQSKSALLATAAG